MAGACGVQARACDGTRGPCVALVARRMQRAGTKEDPSGGWHCASGFRAVGGGDPLGTGIGSTPGAPRPSTAGVPSRRTAMALLSKIPSAFALRLQPPRRAYPSQSPASKPLQTALTRSTMSAQPRDRSVSGDFDVRLSSFTWSPSHLLDMLSRDAGLRPRLPTRKRRWQGRGLRYRG